MNLSTTTAETAPPHKAAQQVAAALAAGIALFMLLESTLGTQLDHWLIGVSARELHLWITLIVTETWALNRLGIACRLCQRSAIPLCAIRLLLWSVSIAFYAALLFVLSLIELL